MAELKPCPFCGRIPTVESCGKQGYFVRCKCGITQDKLYMQKCNAVKRWNKRKIEKAEEVEAIPVPWIKTQMEELKSDGCLGEIGAAGIEALLIQWRETNKDIDT